MDSTHLTTVIETLPASSVLSGELSVWGIIISSGGNNNYACGHNIIIVYACMHPATINIIMQIGPFQPLPLQYSWL